MLSVLSSWIKKVKLTTFEAKAGKALVPRLAFTALSLALVSLAWWSKTGVAKVDASKSFRN